MGDVRALTVCRIRSRWAWRFSTLAPDPILRLLVYAVVMMLPLTQRALPGVPVPLRLLLGDASRWFWFTDPSELIALEEIFIDGEYAAPDYVVDPAVIVDLGANVGQAALWYRSRFPNARMLCVEPDPRTFATLTRNLGRDPLVTLRNVAIAPQDGPIEIERTPTHGSWSTRVVERAGATTEQIAGVSLQTLLDEHDIPRVDVLKVDIEGLEHEALGHSAALRRASIVIGEIHASLLALPIADALDDMRRSGGFERYELDGDIFVLTR